jgi:trehalose 6-phosphate phosphatase
LRCREQAASAVVVSIADIKAAPRLYLCLDFDGTLTPIVSHPTGAHLPARTHRLLTRLSEDAGTTIAVLSGRALSDLRSRIPVKGVILAGNHGLEIEGRGLRFADPASKYRDGLAQLRTDLEVRLSKILGCWVEDKGLTLCVHYRQVEENCLQAVHDAVKEATAPLNDWLLVAPGKCIWDLRPSTAANKGAAALWIQSQLGLQDALTVAMGDDTTDEDLFRAFPNDLTIHVGAAAATAARYCVAGPAEALEFLHWLALVRGIDAKEETRDQQ